MNSEVFLKGGVQHLRAPHHQWQQRGLAGEGSQLLGEAGPPMWHSQGKTLLSLTMRQQAVGREPLGTGFEGGGCRRPRHQNELC